MDIFHEPTAKWATVEIAAGLAELNANMRELIKILKDERMREIERTTLDDTPRQPRQV